MRIGNDDNDMATGAVVPLFKKGNSNESPITMESLSLSISDKAYDKCLEMWARVFVD